MVMKREIETLKKDNAKLQELFNMLRTLPEPKSLDILHRLRLTNADISSLLSSESSSLDDASSQQALMQLPTQGSVEFNLMVRHGFAYPTLAPLDASALGSLSMLAYDVMVAAASNLMQVDL